MTIAVDLGRKARKQTNKYWLMYCFHYFRGQWHGDVAIKMLNMDPETDNAAQLSAFKLEVSYYDRLSLYSVQSKIMYSHLEWLFGTEDIVHDPSCQQSFSNSMSFKNSLLSSILFIMITKFLLFPSKSCLVYYRLTLMTHKG